MELHWIVLYLHFKILVQEYLSWTKAENTKTGLQESGNHICMAHSYLDFAWHPSQKLWVYSIPVRKLSGTKICLSPRCSTDPEEIFSRTVWMSMEEGFPLFLVSASERLDLFPDLGTAWCSKVGREHMLSGQEIRRAKEAHRLWLCWNSPCF